MVNFLTAKELAKSIQMSEQWVYCEIYKARALGDGIPYRKFGPRAVRFDSDEVMLWLESREDTFRPLGEAIAKRKASGDYQPRPLVKPRKPRTRKTAKTEAQ